MEESSSFVHWQYHLVSEARGCRSEPGQCRPALPGLPVWKRAVTVSYWHAPWAPSVPSHGQVCLGGRRSLHVIPGEAGPGESSHLPGAPRESGAERRQLCSPADSGAWGLEPGPELPFIRAYEEVAASVKAVIHGAICRPALPALGCQEDQRRSELAAMLPGPGARWEGPAGSSETVAGCRSSVLPGGF